MKRGFPNDLIEIGLKVTGDIFVGGVSVPDTVETSSKMATQVACCKLILTSNFIGVKN
jgi:hypothetical protein